MKVVTKGFIGPVAWKAIKVQKQVKYLRQTSILENFTSKKDLDEATEEGESTRFIVSDNDLDFEDDMTLDSGVNLFKESEDELDVVISNKISQNLEESEDEELVLWMRMVILMKEI